MQSFWQDFRYGVRLMFKRPGFTAVVIIVLALGIGANTAIFSVVNSVLLRPLNYPDSDRIMTLWEDHTRRDGPAQEWTSPTGFQDWKDQNTVFENIAAVNDWRPTLTESGEPEMLSGALVSSGAFSVVGIKPILGRDFTDTDDKAGAERVAIISYGLWQRRFNGDQSVIGRNVRLSGDSFTIIGVMPAGLQFPIVNNAEIWRTIHPTWDDRCQRGCATIRVLARLKAGVTIERAQTEMSAIAGRIEQQFPETNKNVGALVVPLRDFIVSDTRQAMLVLLFAVGFVLLIACANVANLMLAKAATREREIAIRSAMGASRWQIVRQLLTESTLQALIGGALGVILAYWMVDSLISISPDGTPRLDEVRIDNRVLLFSFGISALTGLLCGMIPALQSAKPDLNQALRDSGAGNKSSARGGRMRSGLVIAEIAIALTLLIGAGLLMRSFVLLQSIDPGFKPANILTARIGLPTSAYPERQQVASFYNQLHERLKALPGVQAVSFNTTVPMTGTNADASFVIEGRPAPPPDQQPAAWVNIVNHDYFRTMSIRLISGRLFDDNDRENSQRTIVISQTMAQRFWPNENPVGKRIGFGGQAPQWREIIGVVADVRHFGLSSDARPTVYFSDRQQAARFMTLVLRTNGDPLNLVDSVRSQVQALDNNLAISNVQSLEQIVSNSIAVPRFVMLLFGSFAAVAMLLAGLGIYGVMAYSVAQRTQEIGIRLALGAQSRDVLRMVLTQGMTLAVIGIALGLAASFGLTRLMSNLLFGISPTDPLTFAVITVLLTTIAWLACLIPAMRATKVDPMIALRYE